MDQDLPIVAPLVGHLLRAPLGEAGAMAEPAAGEPQPPMPVRGDVEAEGPDPVVPEPLPELDRIDTASPDLEPAHSAGRGAADDSHPTFGSERPVQLVGGYVRGPAGGRTGAAIAGHAREVGEVAPQGLQTGLGAALTGGMEVGLDGLQLVGEYLSGGGLGG